MKNVKKLISWSSVVMIFLLSFNSYAGFISGDKWGDPTLGTPGGEVTWSLMSGGQSCLGTFEANPCTISALSSFMPVGFLTELESAFNLWSSVANITFKMESDGGEDFGAASTPNIRIGGHAFDGVSGILGHAYYPEGLAVSGDMHFDIAETWGIGSGNDIFSIAVHEIGHAIGMAHSAETQAVMYSAFGGVISGLHADDISTVQRIYGAPIQVTIPEPSTILLFMSFIGLFLIKHNRCSAAYTH